tara:strand:- start:238 stop:882 length:645 start_codon:yes stop_codon:yes gene_type:complete
MNMIQPHRRSGRRRTAPKRFEDEKFVSGAVDRYQHCYDANRAGKQDYINGDENYYTSRRGHKFTTIEWNNRGKYRIHKRDFAESLLEFSSIWRDMGRVLPGALVSRIGEYLRISDVDKALVAEDDEFIVGDNSDIDEPQPKKWSCSGLPMDDDESEEEWDSEEETDDDEEWDSDIEDIINKSDDEDDDIPTHDGWNHRWGCPPLNTTDNKKYKK